MEDRRSPSRVQPSSSTKGRGTTPAAPKLRDSCHACAASKLKCNKEKPTCARCAKRGITCEYLATKRGGRKHTNRAANTTIDSSRASPSNTAPPPQFMNVTQFIPSRGTWFTPTPSGPSTAGHGSPIAIQNSPRPSGTASDFSTAMLSPVDHPMTTAMADMTTELDEFFATPSSFSIPELSDSDILGPPQFFPTSIDSSNCSNLTSNNSSENLFDNFQLFQDSIPDFSAFSKPDSTSDNHASPLDAQSSSNNSTRGTETPCFCLVRALGLMKQLFPSPNNKNYASALDEVDQQQQQHQSNTTAPTIQTVIAKNEHTIEAISSMLECSCSHDGYLLTIMSLIVFKVLGWYAAAAAPRVPPLEDDHSGIPTPSTSHSRQSSYSEMVVQEGTIVGNYCLEGADADRMAAQLVLSELHRVQRLVNQLSAKLKMQIAQEARFGSEVAHGSASYKSEDNDFAVPLSSVTLDQIIVDLRKRLRTLSVHIAESLRSV